MLAFYDFREREFSAAPSRDPRDWNDAMTEFNFNADLAASSPKTPRPRSWFGSRALVAAAAATAVLLGFVWHSVASQAWREYKPQEGDVLFQSLPRQELVNAIEGCTASPWSHCGIVARVDGRWVVYEAIGEVRVTPIDDFYRRSREGRFAAYRLKPEFQKHVPGVLKKTRGYLGRPYDLRYRMDDEAIYCSELIYKAYRDATGEALGKLVKLGDLKWRPYQQIIERLEGGPVPVDREMITPRDLATAEQLERIACTPDVAGTGGAEAR